jgi:hypothetical protein
MVFFFPLPLALYKAIKLFSFFINNLNNNTLIAGYYYKS